MQNAQCLLCLVILNFYWLTACIHLYNTFATESTVFSVCEPISLPLKCMLSCEYGTCEPSSLWPALAHSCSLWPTLALPLAHSATITLAHSGSLWLSQALIRFLLGSLRRSCIAPVYPALKMMTVWWRWLNQNHDHGKQFWSAPQRGCTRCWSGLGQRGSPEKQRSQSFEEKKYWEDPKYVKPCKADLKTRINVLQTWFDC